jgi:hypothetical protein
MTTLNAKQLSSLGAALLVTALLVGTMTGCSHVMTMMHGGVTKPAASEFGLGPRTSTSGLYTATLSPGEPLRTRRLQTIQVTLQDANGNAVEGAAIKVDGGMPQHGHGLPTQPRVTKALGNGTYVIEGVRFNMGGWWEFKLAIAGTPGSDSVTFNLAL